MSRISATAALTLVLSGSHEDLVEAGKRAVDLGCDVRWIAEDQFGPRLRVTLGEDSYWPGAAVMGDHIVGTSGDSR
jgi:hypothetical protein